MIKQIVFPHFPLKSSDLRMSLSETWRLRCNHRFLPQGSVVFFKSLPKTDYSPCITKLCSISIWAVFKISVGWRLVRALYYLLYMIYIYIYNYIYAYIYLYYIYIYLYLYYIHIYIYIIYSIYYIYIYWRIAYSIKTPTRGNPSWTSQHYFRSWMLCMFRFAGVPTEEILVDSYRLWPLAIGKVDWTRDREKQGVPWPSKKLDDS